MKIFVSLSVFILVIFLVFSIAGKSTYSDNTPTVTENAGSTGEELGTEEEDAPGTLATPGFDDTQSTYKGTEEEDPLDFYPDVFLRKLEQKKLPPLTNKEKIIWSFRLAQTNPFL